MKGLGLIVGRKGGPVHGPALSHFLQLFRPHTGFQTTQTPIPGALLDQVVRGVLEQLLKRKVRACPG